MVERQGQQLLEPLTAFDGYTVPFGEHVRARDLQLPGPPIATREPLAAADSSELDPSDSDYGSAWDFAKVRTLTQIKPAEDPLEFQDDFGYTGEPIFATISPRYIIDTSIPLLDQKWYHGPIPRITAEAILNSHASFSFLVRRSESNSQNYVLSIKNMQKGVWLLSGHK